MQYKYIFLQSSTETIIFCVEQYAKNTDELKESITLFGPYKMAKILHSLDILNTISYVKLSNLGKLSNIHLASVLVEELSQHIKDGKKEVAFLMFLKKEPRLAYVYHKIFYLGKFFHLLCKH